MGPRQFVPKIKLKSRFIFVPGEKMFFVGAIETYPTDHTSIKYDHKKRRYRLNSKKLTWASGSRTTLISRLEVLFDDFLFDSNAIITIY